MNKIVNRLLARFAIVLALLVGASNANAQLEINVGGAVERGTPIAVVPFKVLDGSTLQHDIAGIVSKDLYATGKFEPIAPQRFLTFPSRYEEIRAKDWRFIQAQIVVFGEIWSLGADNYEVQFQIYDVVNEQSIGTINRIPGVTSGNLRTAAHAISDMIYQATTGRGGAFQSRIAYVNKQAVEGNRFRHRLMVADWDGYGAAEVYGSWMPLLSPSWSPDGRKLAFVNLTERGPIIRVHDLYGGKTETIASFNGVNAAPAWSPDGTKIAYSSSRHGSPDIFIYDITTKQHQRLTKHYAIDTEPSWSPDGRALLFTSNRSRKPQIFQYDIPSQQVNRVTFEEKESASASYDGQAKNIVMVHAGGNIVVMNTRTNELMWLTKADFDESPSFSPNGDMVLYVTEQGFQPALVVASVDGRVRTKVEFVNGDVREPAWSPLRR